MKKIDGADILNLAISIYNLYDTYTYGVDIIGIIILIINVVFAVATIKNKRKTSILNIICLSIVFITILIVITNYI